eukprot:gene230-61384_t
MPYIVYVAADVAGQKMNLELEFPFAPTLAELTRQTELAFTSELRGVGRRPPHAPLRRIRAGGCVGCGGGGVTPPGEEIRHRSLPASGCAALTVGDDGPTGRCTRARPPQRALQTDDWAVGGGGPHSGARATVVAAHQLRHQCQAQGHIPPAVRPRLAALSAPGQ